MPRSSRTRSAGQAGAASLRHPHDPQPDGAFLLATLGRLWLAGAAVDWAGFYAHERRQRLPLPTYPFERQRYWIEEPAVSQAVPIATAQGKRSNIADWFFTPTWQQAPSLPPVDLSAAARSWLVFVDQHGLGSALLERLSALGQPVVTVVVGEAFAQATERAYVLDPQREEDYRSLLRHLKASQHLPDIVAHAWSITAESLPSNAECFDQLQERGYYSMLFLARALAQEAPEHPARIGVLTNQVYEVGGTDLLYPEKATLLGPCKVIPQEYSNLACACIDVALPAAGTRQYTQLVEYLIAELATDTSDVAVAYRGGRRWLQQYVPTPLAEQAAVKRPLRERGVYWIVGGLGNVGYLVGAYLARAVKARLVLSSRSGLPPRDDWQQTPGRQPRKRPRRSSHPPGAGARKSGRRSADRARRRSRSGADARAARAGASSASGHCRRAAPRRRDQRPIGSSRAERDRAARIGGAVPAQGQRAVCPRRAARRSSARFGRVVFVELGGVGRPGVRGLLGRTRLHGRLRRLAQPDQPDPLDQREIGICGRP